MRHYRRGGLIGKVLNDQYLFTGLANTRAWQELQLLQKLTKLALPVPKPVAARVCRQGMHYTADIVTVKIADAIDCHEHLSAQPLHHEIWLKIGNTIALLHQNQVYHHDLNIHNIMLDTQGKVWIIDFDKCAVKTGHRWKQNNLDRLLRSLLKERNKNQHYHYDKDCWQALMEGYQQASVST